MIALDLRGFAVSTGAACSSGAVEPSHVLTAIGLTPERARASIRFSLGRSNTVEQVDALIDAVDDPSGTSASLPRARPCLSPSLPPIAVAMSGGVDSSTVAAMLVAQGHAVVGSPCSSGTSAACPSWLSDGATGRCCSLEDVYDARRVAEHLGIPYYVVNFESQFERQVVEAVRRRISGRPHAYSLHALQQLHQVRSVSRNGGWRGRRRKSQPGTMRASRVTRKPAAMSCASPRIRQGPDLLSLRPDAAPACPHAVSAWER